jgi:anti-sigma regulatory factor (Ser/Thr protein kinase)
LAVVAEQLAAVEGESAAVGQASRLGVARWWKAGEHSTVRREIAARTRENAALESELGAKVPPIGSGWLEPVNLELPAGSSAPARARTEIRQAIEAVLPNDDLATVTLLTSELVTNAVIHAQQPDDASIGLRIIRSPDRVRVEVTDSGRGFDPAMRHRPEPGSGGLGLLLVAQLSDRWGTTLRTSNRRHRFCVWFEFRKTPITAA